MKGVVIFSGRTEEADLILNYQSDHLVPSLKWLELRDFTIVQAKYEEKIYKLIKENPGILHILIGVETSKYMPLLTERNMITTHYKLIPEFPNGNIYGQINYKLKNLGCLTLNQ